MSAHEHHEHAALSMSLRSAGVTHDDHSVAHMAADIIDTLHQQRAYALATIATLEETARRLRSELENQRLALQSIGHEVAVANRRIEQTINQTPGVMHADTWPEQGRGESR